MVFAVTLFAARLALATSQDEQDGFCATGPEAGHVSGSALVQHQTLVHASIEEVGPGSDSGWGPDSGGWGPAPPPGNGGWGPAPPGNGGGGTTAAPIPDTPEEWLKRINPRRADHGACPVTWNKVLADDMLAYMKTLEDGNLEHDKTYQLKSPHGPCGENLAWASDGGSVKGAMDGWYNEVDNCAKAITADGCEEAKGGTMTGHFTVVVWKGAREVGCAVWKNFAGCRFMEKGATGLSGNTPNMQGSYVANVGLKGATATGC